MLAVCVMPAWLGGHGLARHGPGKHWIAGGTSALTSYLLCMGVKPAKWAAELDNRLAIENKVALLICEQCK